MRYSLVTVAVVMGLVAPAGRSQGLPDQLNFSRSDMEGFHLYGVSTYGGYSRYDFATPS